MSSTLNATAVSYLSRWLENSVLTSRVDEYANTLRTVSRPGDWTWYTRLRDTEGVEAAEARLATWLAKGRRHEVADGIEPIARAMLALARVETTQRDKFVHLTANIGDLMFPGARSAHPDSVMVTIFNRQAPGCGCNQPLGAGLFAPYGSLELKAITLIVDPVYASNTNLGLVLPLRTKGADTSGFSVAEFGLDGDVTTTAFSPSFYTDGPLQSALGILGDENPYSTLVSSGGDPDSQLGFPGATDLLISNLPALAEYLTDLANKLSSDHKH